MSLAVVITSIQPPTPSVKLIAEQAQRSSCQVIVIGDRKSPSNWDCPGVDYYSFDRQETLPYALASTVPPNSYSRKMLGYLLAASSGCRYILETDDDNAPYPDFASEPEQHMRVGIPRAIDKWVNPYQYFTDRYIWPRGFPLSRLHDQDRSRAIMLGETRVSAPFILQAVADGDPDVDAIYRLTSQDTSPVNFRRDVSLLIPTGAYSPFNSQATTWPVLLLPLMYLPTTCSFRMTDIWRSFIAQRLIAGFGASLVFTSPTVFQERNAHDLMRDFSEEIEGYTNYERFVQIVMATPILGEPTHVTRDLRSIYVNLLDNGFFQQSELRVLDAWIADCERLCFIATSDRKH